MTLDWRNVLAVAAGGALGSSMRYVLGVAALQLFGTGFPWGTLVINVAGSFAVGLIGELAIGRAFGMTSAMRLFLMVGVCGGFTTFSAFSLESLGLMINRAPIVPFAYIAASVGLGIAFCYLGVLFSRTLMHL